MKKTLLKKLQSLTAILALNAMPMSIAHATIAYEAEALQASILTEEKKAERLGRSVPSESFKTLFLENSLASFQKSAKAEHSDQTLMALALIEESYQDQYDALLDRFEFALSASNSVDLNRIKAEAQDALLALKSIRASQMEDVKRQLV